MNTPTNTGGQQPPCTPPCPQKGSPSNKEIANLVFDAMDAIASPILTFSPQWKESIPKRLLDIIPMARMIALLKKEEIATLEECFAYVYTRTLAAPLSYEWADIYDYVGYKTMQQWFKADCSGMKEPKALSSWLQSQLNDLRRYLYNQRREMLKQRLKEAR